MVAREVLLVFLVKNRPLDDFLLWGYLLWGGMTVVCLFLDEEDRMDYLARASMA